MNKQKEKQDIDNFKKLFFQYHTALCSFSYKIVNDRHAANDIVQDVFIGVWKNRGTLDWTTPMKSYLFKSTSNRSISWLEKSKKTVSIQSLKVEPSVPNIEKAVLAKEVKAKIKGAVEKLPPKCKTIFILSRYQNLKYKQIAEYLDISIKTVENQMGIALSRIRDALK